MHSKRDAYKRREWRRKRKRAQAEYHKAHGMEKRRRKSLYLIKRGQKGIVRALFSRFGLIVLILALQALLAITVMFRLRDMALFFWSGTTILTIITVLQLLNSTMDMRSRTTWLVIIMALPVIGPLFFLYTRIDPGHRGEKKRLAELNALARSNVPEDPEALAALEKDHPESAGLARFIGSRGAFPVYCNTETRYFPLGDDMWPVVLEELEKAKKFIFMEFFIIDEGEFWGSILETLARKVKEGVEVRVMYDGTCELSTLPHDYPQRMEKLGIQCRMFAPIRPVFSTHYNYRDHRKILVIDGKTGFTGGVNLADEYVNRIERFGHWKDTAIMLRGSAVASLTSMFLQMWALTAGGTADFDRYIAKSPADARKANGYVIPYGENPLRTAKTADFVYIDILNRAKRYVYIMTPYLIPDEKLEAALRFAAMRGVEVALILPGIPDKKIPYALAKTHYRALISAGVHVYEYTPGFVHAKVFVSDDREAVVGTINLDYRSLYHHFECAIYMTGVDCIGQVRDDFIATREKCTAVTYETIEKESLSVKVTGLLMKIAEPML